MRVAIVSGKGGVGKTGVAVSLALLAAERRRPVTLVDADVETPSIDFLLPVRWQNEHRVSMPIPRVRADLCKHCGACSDFCSFHALVNTPKLILAFPELCRSCGGCFRVCQQSAILEELNPIGLWRNGISGTGFPVIQGRLDVGQGATGALLCTMLGQLPSSPERLTIIDGPPGAACQWQTILRFSDRAILVVDSTRFGMHDLEIAAAAMRERGIPTGVILNRGIGHDHERACEEMCDNLQLPIWLRIAEDPRIARAYAEGIPLANADPAPRRGLEAILDKLDVPFSQDAAA